MERYPFSGRADRVLHLVRAVCERRNPSISRPPRPGHEARLYGAMAMTAFISSGDPPAT